MIVKVNCIGCGKSHQITTDKRKEASKLKSSYLCPICQFRKLARNYVKGEFFKC